MKIDLHTHSVASPDGSLGEQHFREMLESGRLDVIAVTDHNTTAFARDLQKKLGERIIVGEEITTIAGEIIGLYLKEDVPAGLTTIETVRLIKKQGGLVYIPHPFETVRKGLKLEALDEIADQVDIIETSNGRAVFQNKGNAAIEWAKNHRVPGAASSDAHGWSGWGKTYSVIGEIPTAQTLARLLTVATYGVGSPGLRGVLYPKLNRLRKRFMP